MEISLYLAGKLFIGKALFSRYCILSTSHLAVSCTGALEVEIVKLGFLVNREGKRQKDQGKARTKATADFSTTAAKCAAFGRDDAFWVG